MRLSEIMGEWHGDADRVFPAAFVEELVARGRIDDRTAHAMLSTRYDDDGRVRADKNAAGDVPDWALGELRNWQREGGT
jgi:hypothetical protein